MHVVITTIGHNFDRQFRHTHVITQSESLRQYGTDGGCH